MPVSRKRAHAAQWAPRIAASKRQRTVAVLLGLGLLVALTKLVRRSTATGNGGASRVIGLAANRLDAAVGWHSLPRLPGLVLLVLLRRQLRQDNLHHPRAPTLPVPPLGAATGAHLSGRSADGTFNDLAEPRMGSAGTRFGRNVAPAHHGPDPAILAPNPRIVSRELLTRETFQAADTLNVLTAAWIQFMIRDWFSHGKSPVENPWVLPLAADDPWPAAARPMTILCTGPDPTRSAGGDGGPPTHVNTETHWWDASQLYGSDAE
jgi:hypothetical protein